MPNFDTLARKTKSPVDMNTAIEAVKKGICPGCGADILDIAKTLSDWHYPNGQSSSGREGSCQFTRSHLAAVVDIFEGRVKRRD